MQAAIETIDLSPKDRQRAAGDDRAIASGAVNDTAARSR
jgi:hypothetical protein